MSEKANLLFGFFVVWLFGWMFWLTANVVIRTKQTTPTPQVKYLNYSVFGNIRPSILTIDFAVVSYIIFLTFYLQCKIKLITLRRKNGKIYLIIELS